MLPSKSPDFRQSTRLLIISVVGGLLSAPAVAQCPHQWLPGEGIRGVEGIVHATAAWDPDGAGPLPQVLVIGGSFTIAGDVQANNIACWNPATSGWSSLGSGMNDEVDALTVLDGKLYAGGEFTTGGGIDASRIACWDPTTSTWSALGTGIAGSDAPSVSAIAALNGKVYVGGSFGSAGGVTAYNIACWDPATSTWSALGSGTDGPVKALAALGGRLYAGGYFETAGGVSANDIACWDAVLRKWSRLGTGLSNSDSVYALTALGGKLYVGGVFGLAGGQIVRNIACWNPATSSWSALGVGINDDLGVSVFALAVVNGELYAGGDFYRAGGLDANLVACWDPTTSTWSAMGTGLDDGTSAYAMTELDGKLCVGGRFTSAGGVGANNTACWSPDSSTWSALGSGTGGTGPGVYTLAILDGRTYAGGRFTMIGEVEARSIACWDRVTSAWSTLGSGLEDSWGRTAEAWALTTLNGKLYAGGFFITAGGVSANRIACWDPTTSTWSALGLGTNGYVTALTVLDDKLYAGGGFTTAGGVIANHVACWDPATSAWSALGEGMNKSVFALAVLEGKLYAGGYFTTAGGVPANGIACWNPATSTWSALGAEMTGYSEVHALTVLDGKLYVGGSFDTVGGVSVDNIACWDPATSTWSALGSGTASDPGYSAAVESLTSMDGRLYAGGWFRYAGGVSMDRIACWDPATSAWSALGSGVNDAVYALTALHGVLYVGGRFTVADERVSAYWARWGSPGPQADFDCDLDVDNDDLDVYEACATGPGVAYDVGLFPAGCPLMADTDNDYIAADFDGDGDVDQTDFGVFQRCYTGADAPQGPESGG